MAYETLPGASSSTSTSSQVEQAVQIALHVETNPHHLSDFAKTLMASRPDLANLLSKRALVLSSPAVPPAMQAASPVLRTALSHVTQMTRRA